MRTCDICGHIIGDRESWHASWRGLNHALCEINQDRADRGLNPVSTLSGRARIELPLVSLLSIPHYNGRASMRDAIGATAKLAKLRMKVKPKENDDVVVSL